MATVAAPKGLGSTFEYEYLCLRIPPCRTYRGAQSSIATADDQHIESVCNSLG